MSRDHGRVFAALTAMAMLLAACGGGDGGGGGADTEVGQAIADSLLEDESGPEGLTEDQARCISGDIVDGIGEDRLAEVGVTAETADSVAEISDVDFDDQEVETVVGAYVDCIDVREFLAAEFAGDLGEEAGQCLADSFDDDALHDMFVAAFNDEEPSDDMFQLILDAMAECDVPLTG